MKHCLVGRDEPETESERNRISRWTRDNGEDARRVSAKESHGGELSLRVDRKFYHALAIIRQRCSRRTGNAATRRK